MSIPPDDGAAARSRSRLLRAVRGPVRPLEIYVRKRISRTGVGTTTRFVRCPVDGRSIPVDACRRCEDCESFRGDDGEGGGEIVCRRGEEMELNDPPVLGPLTERTPIAAVADRRVLCVNEDVAVTIVAQRLSEEGTGVAIVTARDGRPVGIVSALDCAGADKRVLARDAMTPFVITLLDNATVADALPLVLERGLHHVPILSAGNVLGVVSPTAILRWITRNVR